MTINSAMTADARAISVVAEVVVAVVRTSAIKKPAIEEKFRLLQFYFTFTAVMRVALLDFL